MTREEREDAVERLNAIKQLIGYDKDSEIVKATQKSLDMAIKALEQEPTTKNDLGVDCISRADALSDKGLGEFHFYEDYAKMRNYLKSLPSVTPQEPTDKNFTKADIDAIVKAINEGWELRVNEILSKIRAEISTVYESLDGYDPDSLGAFVSKIDEIFDRYKAEREADNG